MSGDIETGPRRPTEAGVAARLAEAGISAPVECIPGIVANLIVLQDHVAVLRTFPLDDHSRSALEFRV